MVLAVLGIVFQHTVERDLAVFGCKPARLQSSSPSDSSKRTQRACRPRNSPRLASTGIAAVSGRVAHASWSYGRSVAYGSVRISFIRINAFMCELVNGALPGASMDRRRHGASSARRRAWRRRPPAPRAARRCGRSSGGAVWDVGTSGTPLEREQRIYNVYSGKNDRRFQSLGEGRRAEGASPLTSG